MACRSGKAVALLVIAGTVILASATTDVSAQSITSGELSGRVTDTSGRALERVRIVASSTTSGWEHVVLTPRSGEFQLTQVPAGEYELFAEIIGFGPVRVLEIPIRPGQVTSVPVILSAATPPVIRIDTVSLDAGLTSIVTPGSGRWLQGDELDNYPDRLRTISSLAALTSRFDRSMGSEGLPASMTQTFVDGIPFAPARHPRLGGGEAETLIFPRTGAGYLAFPESQVDIEWQGGAGGYSVIGTQSGGQETTVDIFGSGSATQLWSSGAFDSGGKTTLSGWGGAQASLPLVSDTTRLFVSAEGFQVESPRLPALSRGTADELPGLESRAASLGSPWVERTRALSGMAKVDWALSPTSGLEIAAVVGALQVTSGLPARPPALYGTTPPQEALDVLASATLTKQVFSSTDLELRASFQRSVRDYPGAGSESIPGTRLVDSGQWVGLDAALPTRVTRTSFVGGPTLHFSLGQRHSLKAGGSLSIPSFEYASPTQAGGSFAFPSTGAISAGEGSFSQIVGPRRVGSFSLPRVGSFIQYAWNAIPGLTLTSGMRWDSEILPEEDVVANSDWVRASGLQSDSLPSTLGRFSARIGLRWNLTGQGNTVFVAGAGTHHADLDPAAVNEVLSYAGGVDVRRGVGDMSVWPERPSQTAVPVTGERITLLSPHVKAPRTRRAYLGIWQLVGSSTVLRASGSVRRTDHLLRRTDLNLLPAASGMDQFGRPVLGELLQQGGMLTSVVGSNRRFSDFDQVWALQPDGWSEQMAATLSVDHRMTDRLDLFASYTWSETRDNWLGLASGQLDAALDPGVDEGRPTPWSEGISDLDIPHRVAAGLSARVAMVTLSGTYRFRSGDPFTAGYRAGVDANGDGSALNDVAYVPDEDAVLDLARSWKCLGTAVGQFAKRNTCRGGNVHALDVRVDLALIRSRGRRVSVVVEGFNLLESVVGLRDNALLLIDGSGAVTIDPDTGDLTVPVTVNPNFGNITTSTSMGRMLRIGFSIGGGAR